MSRLSGNAAGTQFDLQQPQQPQQQPAGVPDVIIAQSFGQKAEPNSRLGLGVYGAFAQLGAVGIMATVTLILVYAQTSTSNRLMQQAREDRESWHLEAKAERTAADTRSAEDRKQHSDDLKGLRDQFGRVADGQQDVIRKFDEALQTHREVLEQNKAVSRTMKAIAEEMRVKPKGGPGT